MDRRAARYFFEKILQQKPRHEALTSLVNYCYSKFLEGRMQGKAERVALEDRIKELEAVLYAVREELLRGQASALMLIEQGGQDDKAISD